MGTLLKHSLSYSQLQSEKKEKKCEKCFPSFVALY